MIDPSRTRIPRAPGRGDGRRFPLSRLLALAGACLAASSVTALAITDEEIFREFSLPRWATGARTLGMGGAFLAVGEDAAAAQANPAALRYIDAPEAIVEFRNADADPSVVQSNFGSLAVDPLTGARDLPFLGLTSATEPDSQSDLAFVSFAWPYRLGDSRRLTFTGSRQILQSQDFDLASGPDTTEARFAFDSFPNAVDPGGQIVAYSVSTEVSGESSQEVVYWNAGASIDLHADFSAGATIALANLDFQADTLTQVVDPQELFLDPNHPRLPAQPTTDLYTTSIDDSDADVAFTAGIHWHPDSVFASGRSPWRFGAVYRKGAEFTVRETTTLNGVPLETFDTPIVVPDSYGVGLSFALPEHWRFTVEWERIELSDLMDGFRTGVNFLTSGQVAGGAFPTDPAAPAVFDLEDGDIPRIGAEYVHPLGGDDRNHLRFWGGYFRSPDTRVRLTRFNSTDPDVNTVYLDAFRGGEEEDHFTAGWGFRLGRHAFGIAGEISDSGSEFAGTYVFRIGGE